MDENGVRVIEGVLTEDSTPLAFRLAEEMSAANNAFSARSDKGLQDLVDHLNEQNRRLLVAFGRLEMAVNMHAGDAFTGRPPLGVMTVDRDS